MYVCIMHTNLEMYPDFWTFSSWLQSRVVIYLWSRLLYQLQRRPHSSVRASSDERRHVIPGLQQHITNYTTTFHKLYNNISQTMQQHLTNSTRERYWLPYEMPVQFQYKNEDAILMVLDDKINGRKREQWWTTQINNEHIGGLTSLGGPGCCLYSAATAEHSPVLSPMWLP